MSNQGTAVEVPVEAEGSASVQPGLAAPETQGGIEPQLTAKRPRKRERLDGENTRDFYWSLKCKLASLTQDIELLSQEVAKVREDADRSTANPVLTDEEKALLAEKHAKKLSETQKRGISVLLRDIMAHRWAFPFNKPVDTNLYKDYLLKISAPMDFGTIKGRMEAGNYAMNTDAFSADMRQVFQNAFTYNAAGSDVHSMAMTLKEKFEERMKGLAGRMAGVENERSKEEADMRDHAKRRLQEKALDGLVLHRSRLESTFAALDTRIRDAKSEAARGCAFVSLGEKQALVDALAEMKPEDFEFAMQIVVNRHPGLLQSNSEEMDIDLEPLDSLTLRQLSAFARSCLKGRSPDAPNCWPGLLFGAGAPGLAASRTGEAKPSANEELGSAAPPVVPVQQPEAQVAATAPALQSVAGNASGTDPSPGLQQPRRQTSDGMVVQTRTIGERSWSTLNNAAHMTLPKPETPPGPDSLQPSLPPTGSGPQ